MADGRFRGGKDATANSTVIACKFPLYLQVLVATLPNITSVLA